MSTTKPQYKSNFLPSPPVLDEKQLDQFAAERNIPSLVFSKPAEEGSAAPSPETPKAAVPRKAKPDAEKRAPTIRLVAEIPDYLYDQIQKKTTRTRTKRYVLIQALKDAGFTVKPADLYEDGRGGR